MKTLSQNAIRIMLGLQVLVILFHFCILVGIIPYEITWGGRLKTDMDMYIFESVSILINLIILLTLLIKGKVIRAFISSKAVDIILWILFFLYVLNTIGNLFAETNFEKWFAVLTIISAFLVLLILRRKTA